MVATAFFWSSYTCPCVTKTSNYKKGKSIEFCILAFKDSIMIKLSLLLLLVTVLFFGCRDDTLDGVGITDTSESKVKLDSLRFFDSLVDIKKAVDNKLAQKYADRAL